MDFTSFDLQDTEDLFKQNYQLNNNNNDHNQTNMGHDNVNNDSTDLYTFMNQQDYNTITNISTETNLSINVQNHHQHGSFSAPLLSPDGQEGSYTNSSALSSHNPDYTMSPLQIATHSVTTPLQTPGSGVIQPFHTPLQHGNLINSLEDFADEEEYFTPLVSPAMAPTYNDNSTYQSLVGMNISEHIFSPLTSPALHPSSQTPPPPLNGDQTTLQQKLAIIERQQQQLRNMHNQLRPSSMASPILNPGYTSPLLNLYDNGSNSSKLNTKKPVSLQKIAVSSPQFNGSSPQFNGFSPQFHPTTNSASSRTFAVPKSTKASESPLALKPLNPHTTFANNSRPSATKNNNGSSSSNGGFIAPATPSLLMKLGGGNGVNHNTNVPSSSSSSLPSAAVDNMPVLPAAMLQDNGYPSNSNNKKLNNSNQSTSEYNKRRRISQQNQYSSPGLPPTAPTHNDPLLNSPSGVMRSQISSLHSPRALKPLISPSLKPNGKRLSTVEEETARALLTSKSNYENLKEGKAKSLGIDFSTTIQSGIENRRSAHKAAEQKRRDTLKQSFDSLRSEIVEAMVEEEESIAAMGVAIETNEADRVEQACGGSVLTSVQDLKSTKEKDVKQMSKVVLLQHSYEYILRLKNDNKRKDSRLEKMQSELAMLRRQLGLPEVTEEEKAAEEKEIQEEKIRREARLKRLQNVANIGGEE